MFSHIAEPKPKQTVPWVRRLKGGQRSQLTIAGLEPQWLVQHWSPTKGTTDCEAKRDQQAHILDENGCNGCAAKDRERVHGYLWVWNRDHARYEFLELTLNAWREIKTLGYGGKDLRGWYLMVSRGTKDNTRLKVVMELPDNVDAGQKFDFEPSVDESLNLLRRKR